MSSLEEGFLYPKMLVALSASQCVVRQASYPYTALLFVDLFLTKAFVPRLPSLSFRLSTLFLWCLGFLKSLIIVDSTHFRTVVLDISILNFKRTHLLSDFCNLIGE